MSGPPQCSACLPFCIRKKSTPLMVVCLPVAGMPTNSPWWVPELGHPGGHQVGLGDHVVDLDPQVGEAWWTMPKNCLAPSSPSCRDCPTATGRTIAEAA
jgi:hypothetical protein